MKKIYFLLFSLLMLTGYSAQSQCLFTSAFGTANIPANNSVVTISTCSFAGEYSTINGALNGQTLRFTSSVATDFITIRSGTPGGPVVAFGTQPLSFANTFNGTLYAHWATNAACGTQSACRITTVQCTSCPPAAGGCTFTSSFGTATIPASNAIITISTCSFAGEYSTINGALNGQTLRFTSSVGTDFITIHTGTPSGPIVAFGTTPLTFANTFTGTIYAHWATNAACGTQSSCRTTTVQCTSCTSGAPVNDLCAGALPIACAGTVTGTTVGANTDAVTFCGTTLNTAPGVWYTFVGNGQTTTLNTCTGTSYDSKIGVFTGSCASLVCVAGNDDFCGLQSSVTFPTTLGTTYFVLVTGFGTATGAFTLAMTCAAAIPNDICTGALPIGCGQTITGTTATATFEPGVPTCVTTLNTARSLWYTFTGNGANNTLSMCGSAYDTKIGVFTGTCAALVCVTGNDDFCGLQSQVTFPTTLGTTYYVIVTGFGTASGAFTLTRTSAPLPNDACAGAININCGQTITGSTACGATLDAVGTCVTNLNTAPGLWYQFVGDGSPVTISLCGSAYDTKLGIFTGTCAALVCVTGNDDFCGLQSQATFNTNGGFTYYILVTGFGTASGNFTLTRTCAPACAGVPSPGSITPTTSDACVGNSVTLTCSGYSASSQLTFQWSSGPAAAGPFTTIAGATSNVYTFNAPAATTYYRCTVTCSNGGGNGTTAPVVVNVSNIQFTATAATPSTVCSAGSLVTITGSVAGGLNLGNYTYTLTGPGTIGAAVPSGANNSSVSFTVTNIPAGNQVYSLTATDPVPCSKSINIPVTVNLTPVVTFAPASIVICNGNVTSFVPTVSTGAGTIVLSPLTGLFLDAGAITTPYTGTPLASGTTVYARPTVTTTYTSTVTSAQNCSSTSTILITVNQLPAITAQPTPATQTVCTGFTVTYTVGATGTGLTYQWRRNGVNLVDGGQPNFSTIAGATTATLTITNAGPANAGNYDVVVSGTCPPAVTSSVAVLNIGAAPVITGQPSNLTVCANTNASFSVVATVAPTPATYQWQVSIDNGASWTNLTIGGSYTANFTITPTSISQNGYKYRVIVTSNCGLSTTSNAVTLTVNPIPVVQAFDLFTRKVCISDTLVPLVGSPIGGVWTGVGVSGFNFIPPATAVGTYILTYTYTNSFGCTVNDTTTVRVQDCGERLRRLTDDGAITIYPNPNNGRFNIRINSTLYNYLGMKVYDQLGQLMNGNLVKNPTTKRYTLNSPVYSGLVYGRSIPVDLSYLADGTYLVVLYYDDGIRSSKEGFLVVIQQ